VGCDIHTILAVERKPAGRERGYHDEVGRKVLNARDYVLFSILAGVRNREEWHIDPIAEPRGLPAGYIYDEDKEYFLGDHSFSWLSPNELRMAADQYGRHEQSWQPDKKRKAIIAIADYLEACAEEGDTPRFVFGFDS